MCSMTFRDRFQSRPIEIAAGGLMILVGLALPLLTPESKLLSVISTILSTFGGISLSWSASSVNKMREAKDLLKPRINSVTRHLLVTSRQMSSVVQEVYSGIRSPEAAIDLLSQLTTSIYSEVEDLESLADLEYDGKKIQQLVEKASETLEGLHTTRKGIRGKDGGKSIKKAEQDEIELARVLADIQGALGKNVSSELQTYSERQQVQCPECLNTLTIKIGKQSGASAMPTCTTCKNRFHAHRKADGFVFTRRIGNVPPTPVANSKRIDVECPGEGCGNELRITLSANKESAQRYCTDCHTRMVVHEDGSLSDVRLEYPRATNPSAASSTRSNLEVVCVECDSNVSPFRKLDDYVYAFCEACDVFLLSETPKYAKRSSAVIVEDKSTS